jgi:hypothetical protein
VKLLRSWSTFRRVTVVSLLLALLATAAAPAAGVVGTWIQGRWPAPVAD